jgi:hypothetical protein
MPHPPAVVSLSLPMASPTSPPGTNWMELVDCPGCGGRMELHQPDARCPDRLLGVCEDCHRWSILEDAEGRGEVALVMLPESLTAD